jgi:hypothetical protein
MLVTVLDLCLCYLSLLQCASQPCLNGGTCTDLVNGCVNRFLFCCFVEGVAVPHAVFRCDAASTALVMVGSAPSANTTSTYAVFLIRPVHRPLFLTFACDLFAVRLFVAGMCDQLRRLPERPSFDLYQSLRLVELCVHQQQHCTAGHFR